MALISQAWAHHHVNKAFLTNGSRGQNDDQGGVLKFIGHCCRSVVKEFSSFVLISRGRFHQASANCCSVVNFIEQFLKQLKHFDEAEAKPAGMVAYSIGYILGT
jgi:hypothetical protein